MVFDGQGGRRAAIGRRVLRQGMHGDDVKLLQERLNELGFEAGDADGRFGILTKEAVREFQRAHRLRIDGIAGAEVFSVLMSPSAHKRITHVVGEGERLQDIARKYNVPVELLIYANRLKEDSYLYKSQRLIIPFRTVKGYYREDDRVSGVRGTGIRGVRRDLLTFLAYCWLFVDTEGRIHGSVKPELLNLAAGKGGREAGTGGCDISIAVRFGEEGLPASEVAHAVLTTRKSRSSALKNIADAASRSGAGEVEVWLDDLDVEDRYYFYSFIRDLSMGIKGSGRRISVAIPAASDAQRYGETGVGAAGIAEKKGGGETTGPAFDYSEIARHVDHVTLLAFDEHRKESAAGPIASAGWVRGAVKYALSYIPCWKIVLAVPTYGCDWPEISQNQAQSHILSYDETQAIASTFKPHVEWDPGAMVRHFRYRSFRVTHQVWFENAESLLAKVNLVEKYNLAGIALWWLGSEDPAIWSGISTRFKVRRRND